MRVCTLHALACNFTLYIYCDAFYTICAYLDVFAVSMHEMHFVVLYYQEMILEDIDQTAT